MILWKLIHLYSRMKIKIFTQLSKGLFGSVGQKCSIHPAIHLYHPEHILLGNNVSIGPYCRLEAHSFYANVKTNPKMMIENNVSIQFGVHIYCNNLVTIAENAVIASGCLITDNNHGMDPSYLDYLSQPLIHKTVLIGKGVWIGERVCVLPGAEIGEGSIIGANSVVNSIIPPYSIAVGSPAKIVKKYCFESKEWIGIYE